MHGEHDFDIPKKLTYIRAGTLAKMLNVSPSKVRSWEDKTDILIRGRGLDSDRYTRDSVLELIRYYKMSLQSGEPLSRIWRRDQRNRNLDKFEAGPAHLGTAASLSTLEISKLAGVGIRSARRYKNEMKAPQPVVKLQNLYVRGRVLSDNWHHCFVNARGNIEFYGVGEINENDAINFAWYEDLLRQQISALEHDLAAAKKRIAVLEQELINTREGVGGPNSANEREFFGRAGL